MIPAESLDSKQGKRVPGQAGATPALAEVLHYAALRLRLRRPMPLITKRIMAGHESLYSRRQRTGPRLFAQPRAGERQDPGILGNLLEEALPVAGIVDPIRGREDALPRHAN